MRASVTVRVAGSTSNLGAGFDCAGVAGAPAAAALLDLAVDATGLVELCSELEGHPDNVAPAVFGGANLVLRGPDGLIVTPLPIHQSLALVFAVPDFTVETKRARAALPATLPHADAVRAAAKSAALVHGLAHGDARLLAAGLDDVLHVPFRRALVPGYDEVTGAARQAGAYGATLSGSGPTIVAVVGADGVRAVGDAMVRVWGARGTTAQTFHAARAAAKTLRARHAEAVRALVPRGARLDELGGIIDAAFAELEQLAGGLGSLREINPRTIDYLVARGERLSAQMFAAALEAAGCPAVYVDATEVVQTDGTFGNASPDLGGTQHHARRALGPVLARGAVPVVPGFLGAAPDGQVATLGRGGSDLTATLLARVLGARDVSLWKDVPGLLTADPRIVPDARVVPQVHLREAAELAYYGAKVLHPRSLVPVMKQNVAIRIRPFAEPASLGTEISRRRTLEQYPVKALSAIPKQALLTVTGSGMLGVPGIAARTFAAVHQEGISVSLITQASSEHSICFSVPEESAQRARRSLEQTFQREIARQEIDG